jgi:hypothetical protein
MWEIGEIYLVYKPDAEKKIVKLMEQDPELHVQDLADAMVVVLTNRGPIEIRLNDVVKG